MHSKDSTLTTNLTQESSMAYAVLRAQIIGEHGPDAQQRHQSYLDKLKIQPSFARRVHLLTQNTDAIAALTAYPYQDTPQQTIFDWSTQPGHQDNILGHLPQLMHNWLDDLPECTLTMRMNLDRSFDGLTDTLEQLGWQRINERIEFKTPVSNLPTNWQGPLRWQNMMHMDEQTVAAIIDQAGVGPEWEEDDTGLAVLRSCLSDKDLTCDPSCVEIGYLDEHTPAAFIIAQTAPSDGWCTISFMGLMPNARGKNLGQWVHRRGFELFRQQGGKLYHGGTSAKNTAMRRLFEKHQCIHHAHLAEYTYTHKP